MAKTGQQYVLERYPLAFIETTYVKDADNSTEPYKPLYIVKTGLSSNTYASIAFGNTETEAWEHSKKLLKNQPKQTPKEFVKTYFPKARAEKHKYGRIVGASKSYYLIRDGREVMYMASGDTEAKAWKQAKEVVLNILKERKH
jgi:hypothetical protein